MKIDALKNQPVNQSAPVQPKEKDVKKEDFSRVLSMKKPSQTVEMPKNSSREMVQDFAEWYFKQGKNYEATKSYKQAISAYERANSAAPDINKSASINHARTKAYPTEKKA